MTIDEAKISIHALVKRATESPWDMEFLADISIHALVKRATLFATISASRSLHFNPRPREEGDDLIDNADILPHISIHALVKRATVWR